MKTLREVLEDARSRGVAVGHFNFSDLAALKAIVDSARELGLPIFLNADHTHSLAKAEEAARAGFDEIIYDGSALPFDQNINETRRAVEAIRTINPAIVVEGEVGYIGTSSAILDQRPK